MNEDRSSRYHRLRRRAEILSLALGALLLVVLLASGLSVSLRAALEARAAALVGEPYAAWVVVAAYVVALAMVTETISLPLAAYRGYYLEHRYGLGSEPVSVWLGDHAKAVAIGLVVGMAAAECVYVMLRLFPTWWWVPTAVLFTIFAVGLAFLAPIALFPLFYRFVPLDRPSLRERLVALAERAGARVLGVYEWKLGEKSRTANAALVGLGGTRRILLSDTLVAEYTEDEIEVVLAHEIAHHVHWDIWSSMAVDALLTLTALGAAHVALTLAWAPLGLRGPSDVAGLPLLLLAGAGWSLLATPLPNALSRAHEWRADRYALELTRNPDAFIAAMKRLGEQNLAEQHPSRLVEILFHTHPPIPGRIAAARAWQDAQPAAQH